MGHLAGDGVCWHFVLMAVGKIPIFAKEVVTQTG
jgi:hypothetical protein